MESPFQGISSPMIAKEDNRSKGADSRLEIGWTLCKALSTRYTSGDTIDILDICR